MSGTGSLGPSNRMALVQPGTATTGNLVFGDKGVYRKQESMPAAQL